MTQDTAPMMRAHSHEAPFQDIVTPLSARALFWRPRYLQPSGMLHHLPFVFWLTDMLRPEVSVALGVGQGVGYFALCQAMDRLGAGGRCHGLDTRSAEAGGPDAAVHTHNENHYADFAHLHDGDPRETVHLFEDGTVDLLLIDQPLDKGLIQSLTHDWPRKLSDRAVVLLHDTRDDTDAGAREGLMQSLTRGAPCIRFAAGDGLAAVLYGHNRLDRLERLAELTLGQTGYAEVHHVFSRLGAANVHEQAARAEAARAEAALAQATAADQSLAELRRTLSARDTALDSHTRAESRAVEQLATVQARLFDLQTAHDARSAEITGHAKALAQVEAAAIREAATRDAALIRERDRAEALATRLAQASTAREAAEAEAARIAEALAETETGLTAQLAVKERALALATERQEAAQAAQQDAETRLQDALAQAARVEAPSEPLVDESLHAEELRVLTTRLESTQQEVLTLQRELRARADQAARLEQTEHALAAAHQQIADLYASTSWRVAAPLRGVSRLLRRRG